ncbi:peptide ABC transporter substrate-binding protein [Ruficoccus sp. ZRK36]|uniref:peptide ABC transporter substrate-binding protein n=1 Tax=Ruficoccus sp. ZRK36 TaxID=2866311 RepID=UPI001C72B40A|nr:peptide ABC transporter substrate-binding protein [Ruficoccus sp. ZRK36]QYY35988.1 peptide ABC transporter substrate-binding protein [Ruficoccus sp. ZRK36]
MRFLLLILALTLLAGCGRHRTPVEKANEEGILLIGNGTDPKDLDPQITTGLPEFVVQTSLFEGLTTPNPKTSAPEPGVAESWTVNADSTVFTFHLRPEARWSNGDPVTAQDFAFSYERILSPAFAAEYAMLLFPIKNARAFNAGEVTDFSKVGVKALDTHTLELTLEGPTPHLPTVISHNAYFPVHPPTILKFGKMTDRHTRWTKPGNLVSNGPFQLEDWNLNERVLVKRNPYYWDADTVRLNGIAFLPITNQNTEERAFRSGQLHVTNSVPLSKRDAYRLADSPDLHMDPWLGTYYYLLNTARPPFDDPLVREAFNAAIDRQALVDTVTRGGETIAFSIVPPNMEPYQPPASPIREDVAHAQKLLAEAGYPGGKGFPTVELLYNTSETHRPIAEALQRMWYDNLGVEVDLVNQSWPVYLDRRKKGDYDIARAGWFGDFNDASTFLTMWTADSGLNHSGWASPEFDALIKQSEMTGDPTERLNILREAESVFLRDMPIIPLYYYNRIYLKRPEVKGWYPNLLDLHPFKYVYLETDTPAKSESGN